MVQISLVILESPLQKELSDTAMWVYSDDLLMDFGDTGAGWTVDTLYQGRRNSQTATAAMARDMKWPTWKRSQLGWGMIAAIEVRPPTIHCSVPVLHRQTTVWYSASPAASLNMARASQMKVDEMRRLLAAWPRELGDVFEVDGLQAHVRWVLGHKDVDGNEAADTLAKEDCSSAASLATRGQYRWLCQTVGGSCS